MKSIKHLIFRKLSTNPFSDLIRQSAWSVMGGIISKGLMLITSIILARVLTTTQYGELGIIRTTINMFVVFAGFGAGSTSARYIAKYKDQDLQKAFEIFLLSIYLTSIIAMCLGSALVLFAEEISSISFNSEYLSDHLKAASVVLLFSTLNGAYSGGLAGFQDFKTISRNIFIAALVQSVFVIVGALFFKVLGAIFGLCIGSLSLFLMNRQSLRRKFGYNIIRISFKNLIKSDKSFLWRFSIPAAFSSFLVTPVFWWTKTYLIRETSFTEMAHFDVADQWRLIILFIPSALSPVILPALTRSREKFYSTLVYNIKINLAITILISIFVGVASSFILNLYGPTYSERLLFILLSSTAIITSFCTVVGTAIASLGMMWKGFLFNILWAIYMISFAHYFISNGYGSIGLTYTILLSYSLHGITQMVFIVNFLKKRNEIIVHR